MHLHLKGHGRIIHNIPKVETIQVSAGEWVTEDSLSLQQNTIQQ